MTIGNDALEGILDLSAERCRLTAIVNKLTGHHFAFRDGHDCLLRFSAARQRIEIPAWSFRLGSAEDVSHDQEEGYRQGYHTQGTAEADWATVSAINQFPIGTVGYATVVYPGYAWYRHAFELPAEGHGEQVALVLGGCDDQDWLEYWVYVNGTLVGHARPGTERWHEAPCYMLHPGEPGYAALRFGASNTLAVQTRGLDRRSPRMVQSNLERYSVETGLVPALFDQFIALGEPYRDVEALALLSHALDEEADRSLITLDLSAGADLTVQVTYWVTGDEPVLYKGLRVRNGGSQPRMLLEVDVHRFAGDVHVSSGGWGDVCVLGDEAFCGLAHPAGIAQGRQSEARLRLLPGVALQPGEAYTSKVALLGVGPAGEGEHSFVRYLERQGRRRRELLSLYSPYGIYDYAGSEPTEVTEQVLLDNLDHLAMLQEHGIRFDYYVIDTGWNNPTGTLRDFDPQRFPQGPARIVERVRELGMRLGLWISPSFGPAAFRPQITIPELRPCSAVAPVSGQDTDSESDWPGGGPLCLASEPYRTLLREALLYHVDTNGVRCFKLDGLGLMCTNPAHGHLPGKYAVEAVADALIDTLTQIHDRAPDVMIVWYWGARSPWWLLHGATLYEHGIHMEAATPSDMPSLLLRQSVTVSLDQGTQYACDRIPLPSLDSLGVWISDTRWGSWMKSEGWQDAWVMDLARGSLLAQLWGDIALFDGQDVAFLARMWAWQEAHEDLLAHTRPILADPWSGDPYGYAHFDGRRGAIAIHNPGFAQRYVSLRLGAEAGPLPEDGTTRYAITCLHPYGHQPVVSTRHDLRVGDLFTCVLEPFQVVMLQIDPLSLAERESQAFPATVRWAEPSRHLPCSMHEDARERLNWSDPSSLDPATRHLVQRAINGRAAYIDTDAAYEHHRIHSDPRDRRLEKRVVAGRVELPALQEQTILVVVAQLSRDGVYWHHHALFDIIGLQLRRDGHNLAVLTTPNRWHEQAGGWSWITFQASLEPATGTSHLDVTGRLYLPESVAVSFDVWLVQPGVSQA